MEESRTDVVQEKSIIDKISFKPDYTARQWLSQQKPRVRVALREILPSILDSMQEPKPFRNSDEILDLQLGDFQALIRKYTSFYNMRSSIYDDFLG